MALTQFASFYTMFKKISRNILGTAKLALLNNFLFIFAIEAKFLFWLLMAQILKTW